jgi:hypothetical protein
LRHKPKSGRLDGRLDGWKKGLMERTCKMERTWKI